MKLLFIILILSLLVSCNFVDRQEKEATSRNKDTETDALKYQQTASTTIRLNQVGYLPDGKKKIKILTQFTV